MSLTPRLTEWICIFNFKTILPLIHLVFLFATPNRADTQMSSSSCWFRESWPENIIVREPSSNWSIWRWFTPLQPHRILLLFVRRSKCVYIWNSRVRCFFFSFLFVRLQQLRCKMLLRVQDLFLLIWIEGTVHIMVEIQMWKADGFGSLKAKYKIHSIMASWFCAITTWNCWVLSLSCASECILYLSTFSMDYMTEAQSCSALKELIIRWVSFEAQIKTHLTFEFKFVRTLCLQSPPCPTFLPFQTL